MGLFDSLFESEQETESKATFTPWGPAAPGLKSLAQALSGMGQTPLEFFPGQTYAPQTAAELEAIDQLRTAAEAYPGMLGGFMGPATTGFESALGAPEAALGMGLQDVAANPALQGVAERIQRDLNRNLAENILPQLTLNQSIYGSQEVARGIAGRGTQEAYADALADLYGGAWAQGLGAETARYGQGLSAQAQALGMTPAMAGLGFEGLTRPAALLTEVGARERGEAQRAIDEEMQRFQFEQMEPYQRAQYALPGLMSLGQAFGTGTETLKGTATPSPFQQIGGLAMGLGTLAGGLGGLGFLGGRNPAAGIGAQPWGGGYSPGGFPVIG